MPELLANPWFRIDDADGLSRVSRSLTSPPPGRNDPELERASVEWRRALSTDFERVAILVRSAVGKLHIQRLGAP
jgi:hypothetical protein